MGRGKTSKMSNYLDLGFLMDGRLLLLACFLFLLISFV
jgi:hypothetical protein